MHSKDDAQGNKWVQELDSNDMEYRAIGQDLRFHIRFARGFYQLAITDFQ